MTPLFDDLCRTLAQPMPRREALKKVFGTIATGATALLFPRFAFASTPPVGASVVPGAFAGLLPCSGSCSTPGGFPPFPPVCCATLAGNIRCCPLGGTPCGPAVFGCNGGANACCNTGQSCVRTNAGGFDCCPIGTYCVTGCCPVGQDCCSSVSAPNLCCPPTAPKCCGAVGFAGQCCPKNCCCKPNPAGGVICACPGDGDPVFHFSGGGAFRSSTGTKTVVQCDVCANCAGNANFVTAGSGVGTAIFNSFNYGTRTLIQAPTLNSFQGSLLPNGDFTVSGAGTATVNGVPTNIAFNASSTAGATSFQITNSDTSQPLAGGDGEAGLSNLGFSIFN